MVITRGVNMEFILVRINICKAKKKHPIKVVPAHSFHIIKTCFQ